MRDAGVEKAILVGHSLGAAVALEFARSYRAKVVGLVLVDGSLPNSPYSKRESAPYAMNLNTLRQEGYLRGTSEWIDSMFGLQTEPQLRDEIRKKMLATPQHVMISAMEYLANPATWRTDPIQCPALMINCRKYYRDEGFLRTIVPGIQIETWDSVGHFLMLERPTEFNRSLESFIRRWRG